MDSSLPMGVTRSFSLPREVDAAPQRDLRELTVEEQHPVEVQLPTDHLDGIKRRLLIAHQAFGGHALARVAAFVGVDVRQVAKLLAEDDVKLALSQNAIPCWTGAELVARLSVEAETAQKPQDRISALRLLMEYRSMTAPEGGSRSFKRVAAKFTMRGAPNGAPRAEAG